ncbi:MAG: hypothetical protein QXL16_00240 [Candidatus Micrarchaeaceae archaeon]
MRIRIQSSIEFLTVYGFVFLIIGLSVYIILFYASSTLSFIPSQCNAYSGIYCEVAYIYSNSSLSYSTLTLVVSNSGSEPINISQMSVQIRNSYSYGGCTPSYIYPGSYSICVAKMPVFDPLGSLVQGFFTLQGYSCNSGVNSTTYGSCLAENSTFGGAFVAQGSPKEFVPFAMISAEGPSSIQAPPFSYSPALPSKWRIVQNGFMALNYTGVFSYSFGNGTQPFPNGASFLNTKVSCTYPYNTTFSIFSTTLFFLYPSTAGVTITTSDGMEVYYKPLAPGTVWSNVFSGSAWKTQTATTYGPDSASLNSGLYQVEILWFNDCNYGTQRITFT